jgi:plastocyanin
VALAALAFAAAALSACGSSSSSSTSTAAAAAAPAATPTASASPPSRAAQVSISGYAFQPKTVTVAAGAKITFVNHDQTAHTATTTHPGFDTGTVKPGNSSIIVAKRPGTYTFYCQFHAFMHGTVVVR